MSERSLSGSRLWTIVLVCLVWMGCGPAAAPISTNTPLAQDVPKLMENLNSKSATTRKAAVVYLGNLGANGELGEDSEAILSKLREMEQKDESPLVKTAVSAAVAKIQSGS